MMSDCGEIKRCGVDGVLWFGSRVVVGEDT